MLLLAAHRNSFRAPLGLLLLASSWQIAGGTRLASAQEIPAQRAPVPRTIILPQKLIAGAQATLAVIDAGGRLMPGVEVKISGGQKVATDSTGRAFFIAPNDPGQVTAEIPGQGITASSMAITGKQVSPQPAPAPDAPVLQVTNYPRVLAIRDRFTIAGKGFRGAAEADHVYLGDQPCLVVAASPVSLVVLPGPHIPIGAITLRVSADGRNFGPIPVTGVLLDFSGPADAPTAGGEGKLILHVHGSTEPLPVEVRNFSPEIIRLLRGNPLRLGTSGGEENIAPVELKFLASGNYVVTARLVPSESPNTHGGN